MARVRVGSRRRVLLGGWGGVHGRGLFWGVLRCVGGCCWGYFCLFLVISGYFWLLGLFLVIGVAGGGIESCAVRVFFTRLYVHLCGAYDASFTQLAVAEQQRVSDVDIIPGSENGVLRTYSTFKKVCKSKAVPVR